VRPQLQCPIPESRSAVTACQKSDVRASGLSGESDAVATPYRLSGGGSRDNRAFHLYGYSFPLDGKKTVRSFTLPSNRHVLLFGLTLVRTRRPTDQK
jgi:hypothetical protein